MAHKISSISYMYIRFCWSQLRIFSCTFRHYKQQMVHRWGSFSDFVQHKNEKIALQSISCRNSVNSKFSRPQYSSVTNVFMNGNIQIHVHLRTIHYLFHCDVHHCQTWVTDITRKYKFWCDLKGFECTNVMQQNKLAE